MPMGNIFERTELMVGKERIGWLDIPIITTEPFGAVATLQITSLSKLTRVRLRYAVKKSLAILRKSGYRDQLHLVQSFAIIDDGYPITQNLASVQNAMSGIFLDTLSEWMDRSIVLKIHVDVDKVRRN